MEYTFSVLISKWSSYSIPLEIWSFVWKTVSRFCGSVLFKKLAFWKFPVLNLTNCRKCRMFCEKMFANQSEITWKWKKTLKYKKKNPQTKNKTKQNKTNTKKKIIKIYRWVIFPLYANFNCPYHRSGMWDLFLFCWSIYHICVWDTQVHAMWLCVQLLYRYYCIKKKSIPNYQLAKTNPIWSNWTG